VLLLAALALLPFREVWVIDFEFVARLASGPFQCAWSHGN
jgi:hypothetical protein